MPTPATNPQLSPNRAAQYVRMSTEHQQYSPQNQSDTIIKFAANRNMDIVAAYDDHRRSGLNLAGRNGLRQLLNDVESGKANFTDLRVYDVSRWGRFQNADDSAYYEYVLKRAGVRVHYCDEQLANATMPDIKDISITPEILMLIADIEEFKGSWKVIEIPVSKN
jgi:DNA invertase Pin-like site-specific DNA recombinase